MLLILYVGADMARTDGRQNDSVQYG